LFQRQRPWAVLPIPGSKQIGQADQAQPISLFFLLIKLAGQGFIQKMLELQPALNLL
jgi:hypothetical protein